MSNLLDKAKAALGGDLSSSAGSEPEAFAEVKTKGKKARAPRAASAAQRVKRSSQKEAVSKYTGLPKGPGSAEDQKAVLEGWIANDCPFPSIAELAAKAEEAEWKVPSSVKRKKRLGEMVDVMHTLGIRGLTPEILTYLACESGSMRRYYWVVCSALGELKRSEQSKPRSERDARAIDKPGDSDEIKKMRAQLRELTTVSAQLNRSWQKKVEALRHAHREELDLIAKVNQRLDELRESLTPGFKAITIESHNTPESGGGVAEVITGNQAEPGKRRSRLFGLFGSSK